MHIESGERHGHTNHRGTPLLVLLTCMAGLVGCAGSSSTEAPPATAQAEPEPNPVLERDRQMAFNRESPAPVPDVQPPPSGHASMKQDQKAIDDAAATSEYLADHTAAQTKNAPDRRAVPAGTPKSTGSATPAPVPAPVADDTAHNQRDQDNKNPTPLDQSNDSGDLRLTAAVRRAIVGADGLSFTAKNVKIISAAGKVTLRGPVNSAEEKSRVEQIARQAAGAAPVVSQLELAK